MFNFIHGELQLNLPFLISYILLVKDIIISLYKNEYMAHFPHGNSQPCASPMPLLTSTGLCMHMVPIHIQLTNFKIIFKSRQDVLIDMSYKNIGNEHLHT